MNILRKVKYFHFFATTEIWIGWIREGTILMGWALIWLLFGLVTMHHGELLINFNIKKHVLINIATSKTLRTLGKLANSWRGPLEFIRTKRSAKVSSVSVMLSSVLGPQPSVLNLLSSNLSPQTSVPNPRSSILGPQSLVFKCRSSILNPQSKELIYSIFVANVAKFSTYALWGQNVR